MTRARVVVALLIVGGSLVWVAAKGLSGNLVYYRTPTEIVDAGRSLVGERIRVGGLVLPGSVQTAGSRITFVVSDETTRLTVVDTGGVPSLFRAGQGVVCEGYVGADGAFHTDTVLVKHSDRYTPPRPGETPTSADLSG